MEDYKFTIKHVAIEMPVRHPSDMQSGHESKLWARDINGNNLCRGTDGN